MLLNQFLEEVVADGVTRINKVYKAKSDQRKLQGGLAGYQTCLDEPPERLSLILETARMAEKHAKKYKHKDYDWFKLYASKVEWVCKVVSVILLDQNLPMIIAPNKLAADRAAVILDRCKKKL